MDGPRKRRLLLFTYAFESFAVGLLVHELAIFAITLGPTFILRIKDLGAISYSAISVAVASRWICRHDVYLLSFGFALHLSNECCMTCCALYQALRTYVNVLVRAAC